MDDFIAQYPKAFLVVLSGLVSFIACLLALFFRFFTGALKELTTEIRQIRKEFKEDREEDRSIWGALLDRMTRQETICVQHREHCPWGKSEE